MARRNQRNAASVGQPATDQSVRALRRQIHREMAGFAFKPNPTPPPMRQAPWNQLVVSQTTTAPTATPFELTFDANAIWAAAQLQLGLNVTSLLAELRFVRVEAWCTSVTDQAALCLIPIDLAFVGENTRAYSRIEDHCGKNQWARCGYEWPNAIQTRVLESAIKAPIFQVRTNASLTIYTRCHILWRGTNTSTPSLTTWSVIDVPNEN